MSLRLDDEQSEKNGHTPPLAGRLDISQLVTIGIASAGDPPVVIAVHGTG
jgi:hypothetical protein